MTASLVRHGDGWALPLDGETLERLGIDPANPLSIRIEQGAVVIAPEAEQLDPEFTAALAEANESYPLTLKKLAE